MSFSPIAYTIPNYRDFKNYWLKAYEPGTTTPKPMSFDVGGTVEVAKVELDKDGFPVSAGGALVIPYIQGSYDLWAFPTEADADNNDTSNAERFADNITGIISAAKSVIGSYTLAEAKALTGAVIGQIVQITDRENRQYEYKTGLTPNEEDVVDAPSSGLQLQIVDIYDVVGALDVEDLKTKNAIPGQRIVTQGYYQGWAGTLTPSGAASYLITTLQAARDTLADPLWVPDEFGDHTLNNGYIAMLEFDGELNLLKYGLITPGATDPQDASPRVQAACDKGVALHAPSGKYRMLSGVNITSGGTTLRGDGPLTQFDCVMADYLFKFPESTGRSVKQFKDFTVISTAGTMSADGVVFLFDGTGSGGALAYTSGYHFSGIEVGGGGEFACIWDLTDTFRFTAKDCGYTSVTNPVRIRGSVVQCTIDNVTGNNTDYVRSYKSQNCGVYMEVRSDYSDAATRVPENVKVMNCGFVTHRRGILSNGLAITSENNDLDFIRDIGWDYAGGNGHAVTGGYIAHADGDNEFIGVRVQKVSDMEPVDIKGVTFNSYGAGSAKQTAIQIGSGDAPPYAETAGAVVEDNKIFGPALSWDFGIQGDRNRKLSVSKNRIATGTIKAGGKAINLSNSKNITAIGNSCNLQELYISAPVADSVGTVTDNDADVVQEFIAGTLEIARNRNLAN